MATGPSRTADDLAENIRAVVDRLVDAELTKQVARRGREIAATLTERAEEIGDAATEAWHDSAPARRDAAKRMNRASRDAATWSAATWRESLRPTVRDLWKRRTVAIGAAGAAVPVGRELIDTAAHRLGIQRREERHWGAFFLGLILGAIGGAIVALLTAPKPGSEMRRELGERAEEVRDEIAARARETEWVPLFERQMTEETPSTTSTASVQEGMAESGASPTMDATNGSTDATAPAAETYESVDAGAVAADAYAPVEAAEGEPSDVTDESTREG
jgi:gas vesicle protein